MDPLQTIVHALVPYGPVGIVFGAMLWYIKALHEESRAAQQGRLEDAERFRELSLELQEKVLSACAQLAAVVDTLVDATRKR